MKSTTFILALLLISTNLIGQKLEKLWEVDGLEAPEAVVFYKPSKNYFVSNVSGQPAEKNGLGFISKLDANGKIIEKKWATGLNAPKGLGIYKNDLYVADIDVVAVIDLKTGKVKNRYQAEGATFLNDVEVSKNGIVFITDTFGGNAIYTIEKGEISLWLKDESLDYPNGLKIEGKELFVATWGVITDPSTFGTDVPGKLLAVDLKSKEVRQVSASTGNFDGLVKYKDGFLISDWISGVLRYSSMEGSIEDVQKLNPGSADINLFDREGLLLVPQMLDGKLTAYKIK